MMFTMSIPIRKRNIDFKYRISGPAYGIVLRSGSPVVGDKEGILWTQEDGARPLAATRGTKYRDKSTEQPLRRGETILYLY
jgi:hypothetical protein